MASKIHYTTGKQSNTDRQASKTNTGNQKSWFEKLKQRRRQLCSFFSKVPFLAMINQIIITWWKLTKVKR